VTYFILRVASRREERLGQQALRETDPAPVPTGGRVPLGATRRASAPCRTAGQQQSPHTDCADLKRLSWPGVVRRFEVRMVATLFVLILVTLLMLAIFAR
jgi:hypothetical protein